MNKQMNERMNEQMNKRMNERTNEQTKEMFYLTMHSTHFVFGYIVLDLW